MGGSDKVIDFLDLSLSLPGGQVKNLSKWLSVFEDRHDYIEISPRLKNNLLRINSTDFIAFLGYVDPDEISEFEFRKLKALAKQGLEQLLLRSVTVDHQSHYKWCLAALENFKVGRYLNSE